MSDVLDPMSLPEGLGIPAEDWHQTPRSIWFVALTLLKRLEALAARVNQNSSNVPDHGVCCPFSAGRARPSGRGVGAPCLLPPRLPRTSCPSRAYNGCHVRSAALLTRHPHVQRRIMRVESVCGALRLPLRRGSRALTAQHLTNLGCRFIVQPPGLSGSFSSMGDSAGLGRRCGRTETWRWHTT